MIEAKIVCDSIGHSGVRLTTFVLTYPRFIHSEFMTHRMFSRNASSSRAIPVKKSIQMVKDNPVIPLAFTKNKKGMQGGDPLEGAAHDSAVKTWLEGRDRAVEMADRLADLDVAKQYANRILEPFSHITVVCTATDWDNFFALRCHEATQPEIHALADMMYDQYYLNKPTRLPIATWHLPFITKTDREAAWERFVLGGETATVFDLNEPTSYYSELIKRSVARCARVSYLNHDGQAPTLEQDLQLYDRLVGGHPIHASPAEHQAASLHHTGGQSGNFRGWIQYRKTLKNENIATFRKVSNETD